MHMCILKLNKLVDFIQWLFNYYDLIFLIGTYNLTRHPIVLYNFISDSSVYKEHIACSGPYTLL